MEIFNHPAVLDIRNLPGPNRSNPEILKKVSTVYQLLLLQCKLLCECASVHNVMHVLSCVTMLNWLQTPDTLLAQPTTYITCLEALEVWVLLHLAKTAPVFMLS